jgi:DNA polymerase III subunit gamma/tau
VQATFGGTPFDARAAILRAVGGDDAAAAIVAVQGVLGSGVEPRRLADDLLATVRDAFVHLAGQGRVPYDGPAEEVPVLAELGEALGAAGLTRTIDLLGQAIVDIRSPQAPDPRLVLEVAVVRCARRDSRTPVEALADRLERLEARVAAGGGSSAPAAAGPRASGPLGASPPTGVPVGGGLGAHLRPHGSSPAPAPATSPQIEAEPPAPDPPVPARAEESSSPADAAPDGVTYDLDDVIIAWGNTVGALSPPLRAVVQEAQPIAVDGATIVFGVPPLRADAINKRFRAEAGAIKDGLSAHLGSTPSLLLRPHDFARPDAFRAPTSGAPATARPARRAEPDGPPTDELLPGEDSFPSDDDVDLNDLVDAPPEEGPVDSAARLLETFGGEIVEERPRT